MALINYINSLVVGKRVPIENFFSDPVFILLKIIANKEYSDGEWTDKIVAHTYECVDTVDFKHIKVKIEGQTKPLMTNEELQELRNSGSKVAVEFTNATVMPYINERRQSLEDSFKADDVMLVTNN